MKSALFAIFACAAFLFGCKESKTEESVTVNYSKPHAPIEMSFSGDKKLQAGDVMQFVLDFKSGADADDLIVSVTADEGLTLLESLQQTSLGPQKNHQKNNLSVSCQAQQDGLYYLHVLATLIQAGEQQSRSFTIPVNVGNVDVQKQLKSSGVVSEDASGERVISMPAQESFGPAKKP